MLLHLSSRSRSKHLSWLRCVCIVSRNVSTLCLSAMTDSLLSLHTKQALQHATSFTVMGASMVNFTQLVKPLDLLLTAVPEGKFRGLVAHVYMLFLMPTNSVSAPKKNIAIIKHHCTTAWYVHRCGLLLQTSSMVCRSVMILSHAKTAETIN